MKIIGIGKSLESPAESCLTSFINNLSGGISFKIGYLEGRAFHKHKIVILGRWDKGKYLGLDHLPTAFIDRARESLKKLGATNVSTCLMVWEAQKYFNEGMIDACLVPEHDTQLYIVTPTGYGKRLPDLMIKYDIEVIKPTALRAKLSEFISLKK